MTDHRTILRKAGVALILVGMLDMGENVYRFLTQTSDVFRFGVAGVLAVVAGVLVFTGGLRAALWVSRVLAFFLACLVVSVVASVSLSLIFSTGKFPPTDVPIDLLVLALVIALVVWLYRQLTSQPVRDAMAEAGINCTPLWRKPAFGFYVGAIVGLLLLVRL